MKQIPLLKPKEMTRRDTDRIFVAHFEEKYEKAKQDLEIAYGITGLRPGWQSKKRRTRA